MTNFQIIAETAIANNLYTEEQIEQFISEVGCLPLHTFAEWKRMGYCVRKGEKSKMMAYIWRFKSEKKNISTKDNDNVEIDERNFYKTKAYFFDADQVEKIENIA